VDLRRLEASASSNTDPVKVEQLRATSQATAAKMISDVDLYGKTGVGVWSRGSPKPTSESSAACP
jgi:hypothetical protein